MSYTPRYVFQSPSDQLQEDIEFINNSQVESFLTNHKPDIYIHTFIIISYLSHVIIS